MKMFFIIFTKKLINEILLLFFAYKIDSKILSTRLMRNGLRKLIGFENSKLVLLWRGSRDGFGSDRFHDLCNDIPNTLIVVKSKSGCIFGGFTSVPWSSTNASFADRSAYLFSLKNPTNMPLKLEINPLYPSYAVESSAFNGPIFGSRYTPAKEMICADLLISDKSNENAESHMYLTHYEHPNGIVDSQDCGNFIHGGLGMYFSTSEIEVFKIIII